MIWWQTTSQSFIGVNRFGTDLSSSSHDDGQTIVGWDPLPHWQWCWQISAEALYLTWLAFNSRRTNRITLEWRPVNEYSFIRHLSRPAGPGTVAIYQTADVNFVEWWTVTKSERLVVIILSPRILLDGHHFINGRHWQTIILYSTQLKPLNVGAESLMDTQWRILCNCVA